MLNEKQSRFCIEYVCCGIAREAYQRAFGGTDATARVNSTKLMKNPAIQDRIREIQSELASAKIATAQEVQERLTQILRRELSDTVYLPNGTSIERPAQIRDVLKAAEMLAKVQGLFISKAELEITNLPTVAIIDDIGKTTCAG